MRNDEQAPAFIIVSRRNKTSDVDTDSRIVVLSRLPLSWSWSRGNRFNLKGYRRRTKALVYIEAQGIVCMSVGMLLDI